MSNMSQFIHNRRKLQSLRLQILAKSGIRGDVLNAFYTQMSPDNVITLLHMSKVKSLVKDVATVNLKGTQNQRQVLAFADGIILGTTKDTKAAIIAAVGEADAGVFFQQVKLALFGVATNADGTLKETYTDVVNQEQHKAYGTALAAAKEGVADLSAVQWPTKAQWEVLSKNQVLLNGVTPKSEIEVPSFNRHIPFQNAALHILTDEAIAMGATAGKKEELLTAIEAILIDAPAPTKEVPVEKAAEAVAKANGTKVDKPGEKSAPNKPAEAKTAPTTEQLPNPPATENLPATSAQLSSNEALDKIAASIRGRMEDLKADETSLSIIEEQLTAIRQRAGKERGEILESLQNFAALVQSAPTATAAVEATTTAATPAVEVEEEEFV